MAEPGCTIFVNGTLVTAAQGEGAIDAIQRWDPTLGEALRSGGRALADSRGLPAPLDTPVHGGAIFRVVSARQLQADDDPLAGA